MVLDYDLSNRCLLHFHFSHSNLFRHMGHNASPSVNIQASGVVAGDMDLLKLFNNC